MGQPVRFGRHSSGPASGRKRRVRQRREADRPIGGRTLTLDITTSTEYRSPRTADGAWPHLLIQQDFTQRPNIGRIRHLYFAMDLRIEHCERRMSDEQYDESLHTAQSPFYFFMRNTNPRSPDYGLSLWVGVPSFDYRYERLSDGVRSMGHRYGDLHLCDSASQHLGRRLVPRRGVAQRPARPAAADPARRRRHASQRTVRPYHAGGSRADGHELRVGSPRHFRRRTANPQPEHPDRRVARSAGRSFSSRNDGSYEMQPIPAQSGFSVARSHSHTAAIRPETGSPIAYRRRASKTGRMPSSIDMRGATSRKTGMPALRNRTGRATGRDIRLSLPYRR
ncbi:MAG: hypothetical protein ACLR76_03155 [Alistipes sp.]